MDLADAILQAIHAASAATLSTAARDEVFALKARAQIAAEEGNLEDELKSYARIGEICCEYLFNERAESWNPIGKHIMALTQTCEICVPPSSELTIDGATLARRSMLEVAYILREHSDNVTSWQSLLTDEQSRRVFDQLERIVRWADEQAIELSPESRDGMRDVQRKLSARSKPS